MDPDGAVELGVVLRVHDGVVDAVPLARLPDDEDLHKVDDERERRGPDDVAVVVEGEDKLSGGEGVVHAGGQFRVFF